MAPVLLYLWLETLTRRVRQIDTITLALWMIPPWPTPYGGGYSDHNAMLASLAPDASSAPSDEKATQPTLPV